MKQPNWETLTAEQLQVLAERYVAHLQYLIQNSKDSRLVEKSKNELEEINNLINEKPNN